MADTQHRDSGSFLTGLSIGLFAGAAGYFLFGTNRGRKLKEELVKEWQSAASQLPSEVQLPGTLRQFADRLFSEIAASQTAAKSKKTAKKAAKVVTAKRKMFHKINLND